MEPGIRVLIVEDEPAIARGLAAAIVRLDSDFVIDGLCRSGKEGLDLILARDPHLVFADIRMPVMDGLAMIEKAREKNSRAAFVILSGYEQFDYARTALSLGVMCYLLKPVNVDELAALLSRYKEDIFKKTFGERSYLQSPQLTVLWDSLPSAPDIESLSALCDATARFWEERQTGQEQMQIDTAYILNLCIQKSVHKPAGIPDMERFFESANKPEELRDIMMDILADIFCRKKEAPKKQSCHIAEDVKIYLERNFRHPITYKKFYDIFGYNEKYLSLIFRKKYGVSPNRYVTRLRMEAAKQIMQEQPAMLLRDICESVGMTDEFYFSRVFRKYEGVSPGEYAKKIASGKSHTSP